MNIPRLHIERIDARLSIHVDRSNLSVQQPRAKVEIKNNLPMVDIQKEKGQLQVDQSRALEAYGLMNPVAWTTRIFDKVMREDILQGIANIAHNGDLLADIGRNGASVADVAMQNSLQERKLNVVGEASFLNVNIEYIPDVLETKIKEGYPDINITAQSPIIDYTPSKINISVLQYPEVKISWSGLNVDLKF